MPGYGQFCPIAIACETFAERWTPLILRELLIGARRFNELHRGIPLISRTLLAQRLRELEKAGVVRSRPLDRGRGREYLPTAAAEELREVLDRLGTWGQRWGNGQFDAENVDLALLMWNVRRRIDRGRLPARRIVVRFAFRAFPPRCRGFANCWLVLTPDAVDLCLKDPGYEIDLEVRADAEALARVWMGDLSFARAQKTGGLHLEGPRALVRAFPGWLQLSPFAGVERPGRRADSKRPATSGQIR